MVRTAAQNRRYHLHQRIKEMYKYDATKRTIYVPFDKLPTAEPVQELKEKFNYSIQTEIY